MIWYVTCLESVMKELVISHWRGAALCLRFCRRLSLFLFVSPGFVWCRPNGGEEWDRKRRMTSPRCTQRCLFLAPRGENTILKPVYCPWLSEWWFFSSHGLSWTDALIFLDHTTILITLHQIVCSRIGRRHCPWLCFVSTLLLSVLFKD